MAGFNDVFTQSTQERSHFVIDFLLDLEIQRVDMLVGVGASCYTVLQLAALYDLPIKFNSIALISPWSLSSPRSQDEQEIAKKLQKFWDRPFYRSPVKVILPKYKIGRGKTTEEKVAMAYLLNNLDLGELVGVSLAITANNIPRTVIFGEQDPEVNKEQHYELLQTLNIPERNVFSFKGKLDAPRLPGALVFPNGGYDLHLQQSSVISLYLLNLIQLFHPQIQI